MMNHKISQINCIAATAASFALLPSMSQAAVTIAEYNFTGGSTSVTAGTKDANLTANDFTVGADLATSGFSISTNSIFARTIETGETFAAVQAGLDYFTVTIGANAGFAMNLASFVFNHGLSSKSNAAANLRAHVTTSIDNHAVAIDGPSMVANFDTGGAVNYTNTGFTFEFDGAQFQNITSDIEFRIYLSDAKDNGDPFRRGATFHRIDDVTLNGTVTAVPEPSGAAILGLGDLSLILRPRR